MSESVYRRIVEQVTDLAILYLDETGHITLWNAGAEAMMGHPLPQGSHRAEYLLAHGHLDAVVPRPAMRQTIVDILGGETFDDYGAASARSQEIGFPAIVKHGRTLSAANVSDEWIGLEAEQLFERELGSPIHFINDADAAG